MHQKIFQNARFLIVDDEEVNVAVLVELLKNWDCFNVHSTTAPREAAQMYSQLQPDIILLDLMMPEMNGFEVMEQLKPLIPENDYMPILVLTADTTANTKRKA